MTIDDWWPLVNREAHRWVAGNVFTPLSQFSLEEIEKDEGPDSDDPSWARDREVIERYLPTEVVSWISANDCVSRESAEQDPRAAYFRTFGRAGSGTDQLIALDKRFLSEIFGHRVYRAIPARLSEFFLYPISASVSALRERAADHRPLRLPSVSRGLAAFTVGSRGGNAMFPKLLEILVATLPAFSRSCS